jgi:hypothetical protein
MEQANRVRTLSQEYEVVSEKQAEVTLHAVPLPEDTTCRQVLATWRYTAAAQEVDRGLDWIGLWPAPVKGASQTVGNSADVTNDQSSCLVWDWVSKATQHTLALTLPAAYCGQVIAKYYVNDAAKSGLLSRSYKQVAVSEHVPLGPQLHVASAPRQVLEEVKTKPNPREIQLCLTAHSLAPSFDLGSAWVGLYTDDRKADEAYSSFKWLSHADSWVDLGQAGEISFPRPENKADAHAVEQAWRLSFTAPRCGPWQIRVFPSKTYQRVAQLDVVLDGEDVILMETDPADIAVLHVNVCLATADPVNGSAVWVWIGFQDETRQGYYRRYQYISRVGVSHLSFKTPIHKGTYEARLFVKGQTEPLARSNLLDLPDRT